MRDIISAYFNLQQKVYDYFGYVDGFAAFTLEDCTDYFWFEEQGEVNWSPEKEGGCDDYCEEIYGGVHLPKAIYRGPMYTMIAVQSDCEGNRLLLIFDNTKEVNKKLVDTSF